MSMELQTDTQANQYDSKNLKVIGRELLLDAEELFNSLKNQSVGS